MTRNPLGSLSCEIRFRTGSEPGSGEGEPASCVAVASGTTLLEAVRRGGLPIARACSGGGLCGRCGLSILAGGSALAPEGAAETRAKAANRIDPALRLACQVRVRGPLEVSASYW